MTKDELIRLATDKAKSYKLDPRLVCCVCEQESGWDTWSIRFEPNFYSKYVQPQNIVSLTEAINRAQSFGLCQVMGQVAREHGFKGMYLTELCNPEIGVDIGCKVLRGKLNSHPSSLESGLNSYNGGSRPEYASEVLARMEHYKEIV